MIHAVNVRNLKDKLSAYLKNVQRGDIVLVSDRGRVVAEIRRPTFSRHAVDEAVGKRTRLVEEGVLRLGLPNSGTYSRSKTRLSRAAVDEALRWSRGDR